MSTRVYVYHYILHIRARLSIHYYDGVMCIISHRNIDAYIELRFRDVISHDPSLSTMSRSVIRSIVITINIYYNIFIFIAAVLRAHIIRRQALRELKINNNNTILQIPARVPFILSHSQHTLFMMGSFQLVCRFIIYLFFHSEQPRKLLLWWIWYISLHIIHCNIAARTHTWVFYNFASFCFFIL